MESTFDVHGPFGLSPCGKLGCFPLYIGHLFFVDRSEIETVAIVSTLSELLQFLLHWAFHLSVILLPRPLLLLPRQVLVAAAWVSVPVQLREIVFRGPWWEPPTVISPKPWPVRLVMSSRTCPIWLIIFLIFLYVVVPCLSPSLSLFLLEINLSHSLGWFINILYYHLSLRLVAEKAEKKVNK